MTIIKPPRNIDPTKAQQWREAIERHRAARLHWFDREAVSYFSSRVLWETLTPLPLAPGCYLFVSSEQFRPLRGQADSRRYTVRFFGHTGAVDTLGEFQQYETANAAKRAIREVIAQATP
jgi:hypothetical protein